MHPGRLRGAAVAASGDLIFTTAATGWGEILSDPSYDGQIVVLTHPIAGNYPDRAQPSWSPTGSTREPGGDPPGHAAAGSRAQPRGAAERGADPAIEGIDTRALTLELRRGAARRTVIAPGATRPAPWPRPGHHALGGGRSRRGGGDPPAVHGRAGGAAPGARHAGGLRRQTLAAPRPRGARLRGHRAAARLGSRGNAGQRAGPRRPVARPRRAVADGARDRRGRDARRRSRRRRVPILGICLGHQLLALAAGGRTARLPVGHHGGNHAVIEIATGRVDIGAHNHEVAVLDDPALVAAGYRVSHRDLNDGTVEGLVHASGRIASVQFHPEGAPGPIDGSRVFDIAAERAVA